jgi:hypothetical protein
VLQRSRHAGQRETTCVPVRIEIHLRCTPEAFTDEQERPEIGDASGAPPIMLGSPVVSTIAVARGASTGGPARRGARQARALVDLPKLEACASELDV